MRSLRGTSALGIVAPLLLAGLLPLQADDDARWPVAGAWRYPVGDPYVFGSPVGPWSAAFQVSRGLQWTRGKLTHQGADLLNGRRGDSVYAAACGIVVSIGSGAGDYGGYGNHVVLAHRLVDGRVVYTVYAHLSPGTIEVRPGGTVEPGALLARVGRSGRATTPHLHFEVREPSSTTARWEGARCAEPLAFIAERLPSSRDDTSWARPYLEWAEAAGMVDAPVRGNAKLTRAAWWRAIGSATRGASGPLPGAPKALRDSLIQAGLLPEEEWYADPEDEATWRDMVRDLKRARRFGLRPTSGPLTTLPHREHCRARFDEPAPSDALARLARRRTAPTLAEAFLLVADEAGARNDEVVAKRTAERPATKPPRAKPAKRPRKEG